MANDRLRVPGEDIPGWLIGVFGLIGLFVAAAAAWQWIGAPTRQVQALETNGNVQVPSAPAAPTCPDAVSVPFPFDSAVLDAATIAPLVAPLVERIKQDAAGRLVVLGHADAAGRERYNFLLSYRRAQAVAAWLSTAGVPSARVRVRAAGSQEPIEGLSPVAGENRRAGVYLVGIPGCPDN